MAALIDETGNRYGRLFVVAKVKHPKSTRAYWRCRCDCGKTIVTNGYSLRCGDTTSCGCYHSEYLAARNKRIRTPAKDETGKRYGKLLVIKKTSRRQGRQVCWQCLCDCGNKTIVSGDSLRKGNTASCGCSRRVFPPDGGRPKVPKATEDRGQSRKRVYRRNGTYFYVKLKKG